MNDGSVRIPPPVNEPIRGYASGTPERASLAAAVTALAQGPRDAPCVIAGERVHTGTTFTQHAPHRHDLALAEAHAAARPEVERAIEAAVAAQHDWAAMPFEQRAAIFLRAADLLAGPWRDRINAATILGQSKSVQQAEIDAACELIDFLRFNVAFAERLYDEQPTSGPGEWNRLDHRPLEGFVLAMTPFNFTAIAGNLPTAPAMVGNTVVWKPSEKQVLAAQLTMELLEAAGLPDGVINLVHGDGATIADIALADRRFAALHFTGSEAAMTSLWGKVGANVGSYNSFPRIVGESGGKDFVIAHPSAPTEELTIALAKGAFEYQGQKCSAASRAYLPRSRWPEIRDQLADVTNELTMGDVGEDLSMWMGAVIDGVAFAKHRDAIARALDEGATRLVGTDPDDSQGWFVPPTVLVTEDPRAHTMVTELFGPILTVHVYDDADFDAVLDEVDAATPYALTGAIFAQDRAVVQQATDRLRHAAGNLYINDKPTGSVVGRQPFGGARRSGTNDKAGSLLNMMRWISPRAIKETSAAPTDWRYPHQG